MNVTYEKKDAMTFIGYHTEIHPEEAYQKCPEFWDKEYAAKYTRLWQTMKPENAVEKAILENGIGMFAICAVYILDRRSVSGRRRSGRTGTVLFPGKRVGGFYNKRTDAGFPADAEYGGLAGVVPE